MMSDCNLTRLVTAVVIDDEPHVRRRIIDLMSDQAEVELIGECSNGIEAVAMINERRPDLLFLDI